MTGPLFRRLDPAADSALSSGLEESRILPVLAHLAADLLAARARGDDPAQRAPRFADLTAAGLTAADCQALISDGLLAALPQPSARNAAGTVPVPPARRAGKSASAGRSSSRSKNGQRRGTARSTCPTGRRQPTGKSPSATGSGQPTDKSPSPARRGRGEGGTTAKPLHLGPRTRLLLTDAGLASITKHAQTARCIEHAPCGRGPDEGESPSARFSTPSLSLLLPHYDIELRELSVAGVAILRLRVQAHNLAAILASLQLAGWKPRVAKPLNGRPEGNEPSHLADAIYSLNQRQSPIDFSTDGGAVRWEWRAARYASDQASRNGSAQAALRRNSRPARHDDSVKHR